MSTFLYTRPTERLAGTLAVNTGTGDTAYLPANLDDGLPSKPAKLTGTSGSWTRDLGSALQVDYCAIVHHNLAPGVDLRLQGHSSNAWGAPTVDLGVSIPAAHADGFTKNVGFDLVTDVPLAATRTLRWWRLLVNSASSLPVSVGEWPMYSGVRNLGVRNISWGSSRTLKRPAKLHLSEFGVRRSYDLGTTMRTADVRAESTSAVLAEIDAWWRSAYGATRPFVIVPNKDEDEPWFVNFVEQDLAWTRELRNYNPVSMRFEEVSRGLNG